MFSSTKLAYMENAIILELFTALLPGLPITEMAPQSLAAVRMERHACILELFELCNALIERKGEYMCMCVRRMSECA